MNLSDSLLCGSGAVRPARVTLVGAGPGDPELLTMKAVKALTSAQLVPYDHLVDTAVLALLPENADRVYVGKQSGQQALSQQGIIELMLRLARSGRPLLRLKGGDPYIFGRGGEEAQALAEAGVPFEVIPGISAAQGAAACAGIPLTHREHASTLCWVTGHLRAEADEGIELDWLSLARPHQTLVVYMGLASLPMLSAQLIAHGLDPLTPAAVVERATLPNQRTLVTSLQALPNLVKCAALASPALIIIGTVVSLRALLSPPAQEFDALVVRTEGELTPS